jgi:hypothetical protein
MPPAPVEDEELEDVLVLVEVDVEVDVELEEEALDELGPLVEAPLVG